VKILNSVKFPSFLEPVILILFQLKPREMIYFGAKGTGDCRTLLPLSVRHADDSLSTYLTPSVRRWMSYQFLGTVKP